MSECANMEEYQEGDAGCIDGQMCCGFPKPELMIPEIDSNAYYITIICIIAVIAVAFIAMRKKN